MFNVNKWIFTINKFTYKFTSLQVYKFTATSLQLQVYSYKFTATSLQLQVYSYKFTATSLQLQVLQQVHILAARAP
jgi:hypothetical protein